MVPCPTGWSTCRSASLRVHNGRVLFAELVALSGVVQKLETRHDRAARVTSSLREASPREVPVIAGLLTRAPLFDDPGDEPFAAVTPRQHPSLHCPEVADAIDEIDQTSDEDQRRTLIEELMRQATVDEQRWIGAAIEHPQLDRRVFDLIVSACAAAARVTVERLRRAATLSASLPLSIRIALDDGDAGLESVTLEPGRPIPPTLLDGAERVGDLLEELPSKLVEWNLAADRIQVHRRQSEVAVYDEYLEDVTEAVPVVVDQVATFAGGDLVLDGWADLDPARASDSLAEVGRTARFGPRRAIGEAVFCDLLFAGTPLVDEPLWLRRELLASVVPAHLRLPTVEIDDLHDLAASVNECLRTGHAGLFLKPLDGHYEGGLVQTSWRRIEAAHIVKLVVVAAERGRDSRSHLLSTVHLAARDDRNRFQEVARTARGLSQDMIVRQTAEFADLMLDGHHGGSRRLIRLRPEIIAVAAIEGVDENTAELVLRRPRLIGYERGETADVTTVEELREMARANIADDESPERDGSNDRPRLPGDLDLQPGLPRVLASIQMTATPAITSEVDLGGPLESSDTVGSGAVGSGAGELDVDGSSDPPGGTDATLPDVHAGPDADEAPIPGPVRPTPRWTARGVIVTRVVALVWVTAILVAALDEKAGPDEIDGSDVAGLGRAGFAITSLLAVTGWAWCDQLVRSTVRTDRRPGRVRCATAWLLPLLFVAAISLVVAPLEPTEPVDVRPALIAASFGLVIWQPYALVRRLLPTPSRRRSDVLIAPGYVIDVMAFGILWWQLTLWGDGAGVSQGEIDVLVGAVGAVAISMALNVVVWLGLLAAAREAAPHKPQSVHPEAAADRAVPMVDDRVEEHGEVEEVDRDHDVVSRRLDVDESTRAADRLRGEFGEILPTQRVPSDDDETPEIADSRQDGLDVVGLHSRAAQPHDQPEQRTGAPDERAPDSDVDDEDTSEDTAARDDRLDPTSPHGHGPRLREVSAPGEPAPDDRAPDSDVDDEDPIVAMRRRTAGRTPTERLPSDIGATADRPGPPDVEHAAAGHHDPEHRADATEHDDVMAPDESAEHAEPPRRILVTAVRLVMVGTFAVLTLVAAWLISLSLSSDTIAGTSEVAPSVVSDLELARTTFWGLLTAGAALLPVWSLVIVRRAAQVGIPGLRLRRVQILALVAVLACVGGFVFDANERGVLTLLLCVPIIWSAVAAGFCVEPVRAWFELPTVTLTNWIATLPAILGVAWLAGLSAPIEATASLQRLAFTTILLTLGCARVTVMSVLSSLDIERELRASSEPTVPTRAPHLN